MHELNGLALWPLLIWNLLGFKKISAGNQLKKLHPIHKCGGYSLESCVVQSPQRWEDDKNKLA